jgi:redox-sensitive bicupin YhaK (pirin superfamily)
MGTTGNDQAPKKLALAAELCGGRVASGCSGSRACEGPSLGTRATGVASITEGRELSSVAEAAMIAVRKAQDRGHFDHGWLDTSHTFSFAGYVDPEHMGFSKLRVINEDRVKPGEGFGRHGHRDMEIVSWVLEGELAHRDSTGGGGVLRPGEVQRMSAGTGVTHSEFNGSQERSVHFLQIWILPNRNGYAPSYEQKAIPEAARRGRLALIASQDGAEGSTTIHQDARIYATLLGGGERVHRELASGRHGWVQVARGSLSVNGNDLAAGDGAALSEESDIELVGRGDGAEALVFDLP